MSAEMTLTAKLVELMAAVGDLRESRAIAETKLKGAEERCVLLLEAKNLWMDRALKAETSPADAPQAQEHPKP